MSLSTNPVIASLGTLEENSILPQADGQKFLRFGLQAENTALLQVADTAAIFQVTQAEILPVPQMPSCVLGIYNWRSEMLWTIDLAHLLGLTQLFESGNASASAMVVVIEVDSQYLGLVVAEVIDIEWYNLAAIQTPSAKLFSPELLPFMQGYIGDSGSIVLDPVAIAQSPLLQLS